MKNLIIIPLFWCLNLIFTPVFAKEIAKKDHLGFWMNAEEAAIKEATKTKKPLFIDFYGIWCPPCNQLDELVYATKEFKQAAKKYVLLKMDADSEKSWVLKSKFKVGGYPTIILASPESATELGRIVGYYPTGVITTKMKEALSGETESPSQKILKIIEQTLPQEEDDDTLLKYLEVGLVLETDNLNFKLSKLKIQSDANKDLIKSKDSQKLLNDIITRRKDMSTDTLIKHFEIQPTKEVLDELLSRVNPTTLFVDNEGLNQADIFSLGADWSEKDYLNSALESYEKLLKKYGPDSRSLNLSYTYYLVKAKDYRKAQEVFDRLIKKYPHEFTFYYQAAQMALEMKNYIGAKKYADQALEYAYGDNKIRSMDRLVKIAIAENNKTELKVIIERAEKFLKESKTSGDLKVRTDRYLNKLAESLDNAKKLI